MADLLFLCQIHLFAVAKSVTICYTFNLCGRQPVICVAGAVLAFLWRGRLLLSEAAVTDCFTGPEVSPPVPRRCLFPDEMSK